jgi:hypothetical protein
VRQDDPVTGIAGERDRPLADIQAGIQPLREHVQLRLVAQREREKSTVPGALQYPDRLLAGLFGAFAVTEEPVHPGQPPQTSAERHGITQLAAQCDGVALRRNRGNHIADRVALDRVLFEQRRAFCGRVPVPVPQRAPVVGGRLTVRAGGRRLPGGQRPVPDRRLHIAGEHGVVHDPGEISTVLLGGGLANRLPPDQRSQDLPVHPDLAGYRQRIHDRPPDQLVLERHRRRRHYEQAAFLGGCEARQAAGYQRFDQPAFHYGRYDGELLQRVHGGRVQPSDPGEYGVDHGGRDGIGGGTGGTGEHFGDEERVAGRQRVHVTRVERRRRAQLAYRRRRQSWQRVPAYAARRRCLAEQLLQRMRSGQLVVAVRQHQNGRQVGDPADQVPQHVQRRFVGPVHVLDGEDRRLSGPLQFIAQRGQHGIAVAAVAQRGGQVLTEPADQVAKRAERTRGRQVVALADQQTDVGR